LNPLYFILLFSVPFAGGVLGYTLKLKSFDTMKLMLAFAGSYLLAVVLMHLVPHIYAEANYLSGIMLLGGFLFQFIIERYSHGVEHGHIHLHDTKAHQLIPLQILISLSIHSFMEGMPLGSDVLSSGRAEWSFVFGIVLHEFPAAFALTTILKSKNKSQNSILLFAAVYASMSSLGAFTANLFGNVINHEVFEYIMAFVAGTFLHIATTILFENSENHKVSKAKIIAIAMGIIVAYWVSSGA